MYCEIIKQVAALHAVRHYAAHQREEEDGHGSEHRSSASRKAEWLNW